MELLVVMGLMGLIGTLVMSVSVQTAKVLTRSGEREGDTQQVRVALEAVTRALRGAVDPDTVPTVVYAAAGTACNPAGTTGTGTATDATRCAFVDSTSTIPELRSGPRQVAFWSSVNDLSGSTTSLVGDPTAPVLHRYALTAAGEVTEEVWTGNHVTPAGTLAAPSRRRVLARGMDVSSSAPAFFTYLSPTDTTLPANGPTVSSLTTPADPLLSPADVSRLATVEVWLAAVRERGGRSVTAVDSVVLPNDPEVTAL